jgi:hypothetical protein
MEFHIKEAIQLNKSLYLSNPDMYRWIHGDADTCNTQHDNEINAEISGIIIMEIVIQRTSWFCSYKTNYIHS